MSAKGSLSWQVDRSENKTLIVSFRFLETTFRFTADASASASAVDD